MIPMYRTHYTGIDNPRELLLHETTHSESTSTRACTAQHASTAQHANTARQAHGTRATQPSHSKRSRRDTSQHARGTLFTFQNANAARHAGPTRHSTRAA
eukprot:3010086-Pyramimonas_sp.AAC.1